METHLRLLQRKLEVQVRRPTSVVVVAFVSVSLLTFLPASRGTSDEGENFSSTKFLALVEPVPAPDSLSLREPAPPLHARSCQVAVEGPDPTPVDDVLCDDHMSCSLLSFPPLHSQCHRSRPARG
eukprot:768305-Hanusia_phi.AAC.2